MKTTITKALATAGLLAAVGAAPLMGQGHMGQGHGNEAPQEGMMMHQMMEECPTAHGEMMGAQLLLEHANALELSADQLARLEALQEQQMELRAEMMEAMATIHEVLTPEQREALQEQRRAGMGPVMQGMQDREGMSGMMHGMRDREGMPGMMHGMMGGEGHEAGAGMMGPHAADCPMMGKAPSR